MTYYDYILHTSAWNVSFTSSTSNGVASAKDRVVRRRLLRPGSWSLCRSSRHATVNCKLIAGHAAAVRVHRHLTGSTRNWLFRRLTRLYLRASHGSEGARPLVARA